MACSGAGVDDGAITAVAVAFIVGDACGHTKQMAQQRFIATRGFVERFHVFARYHEDVRRCLRVDVTNGNAALVLMDQVGGNFAGDYFAEKAVVVGHCMLMNGQSRGA